jgi:hypothetical protein
MRRVSYGLLESLVLPVTDAWPTCDLCTLPLDKIELVERAGPTAARVLGKHHGAEELATFELGTREWEPDDLQRAVRGHRWFRPETVRPDAPRAELDLDSLGEGVEL